MKKLIPIALLFVGFFISCNLKSQQDKSTRPSPPAIVTQEITSGAVVSIDYSQPSVKGRTIGKDLDPIDGEVWRTGANEATVFENTKALTIMGKELPAGKYGLFSISGAETWTIIFNKTWKQWGASSYNAVDDVLRITVKPQKAISFSEKMTITIEKNGMITLLWGDNKIAFEVQ